jgi:hypothetical protein
VREEGRGREGRGKREEGRGKREEGRGKSLLISSLFPRTSSLTLRRKKEGHLAVALFG